MRSIEKIECAVLPLVLKGEWYDLIAAGEKKEEYRDLKPYWEQRIAKWLSNQKGQFDVSNKYLVIAFSRGYRKADMFFMLRYFEKRGFALMPEWGEPAKEHLVLGLGERVAVK